MGERVSETKVDRSQTWTNDKGQQRPYLYFVGKDGYVWRCKPKKKDTNEKIGSELIIKEKGYMYYVDGEGYVCKAQLKHAREKEEKSSPSLFG